jgi:hypothetical protein
MKWQKGADKEVSEACLSIASARGPQGGHGNWMPTRLSDESPKKNKDLEHSEHFHEVYDPFLFSAPPFTVPRKHARVSSVFPCHYSRP